MKLIFALLDEQQTTNVKSKSKRSKENDEQEGMHRKSDLEFSSGVNILPGLALKSGTEIDSRGKKKLFNFDCIVDVFIAAVCFFQDKPDQIAVFYEPVRLFFWIYLIESCGRILDLYD